MKYFVVTSSYMFKFISAPGEAFVLCICLCAIRAQPQHDAVAAPQWETAAGGKREFEVASVKPSLPMTPFSTNMSNLDGLDGPTPTENRFAANAPLMAYLLFAYKITDSIQGRSIYDHLPDWARSQFFNVEARAHGVPTRDQLRLMVQALLADRFKLAIHREMQIRHLSALSLVKPNSLGPYLKPHPPDEACRNNPGGAALIEAPRKATEFPRYCGLVTWNAEGRRRLRLIDVTAAQMANYLASASMAGGSNTPIGGVDRTGLKGRFDLDLDFTPDVDELSSNIGLPALSFKDALKQQLGLKLVDQKGSVVVLLVDHLEKPSAN